MLTFVAIILLLLAIGIVCTFWPEKVQQLGGRRHWPDLIGRVQSSPAGLVAPKIVGILALATAALLGLGWLAFGFRPAP
jgi:hypothetical protein